MYVTKKPRDLAGLELIIHVWHVRTPQGVRGKALKKIECRDRKRTFLLKKQQDSPEETVALKQLKLHICCAVLTSSPQI